MSAEALAQRRGHIHQAALYQSDDELVTLLAPFLEHGRHGHEPTLVVLNGQASDLLRRALGDTTGITFLDPGDRHHNPAVAIRSNREILAQHTANGASRIRVLGEVPHPGLGAEWEWWARYEATINHAYAEFPLWNICSYDVRITPEAVLDDVARTHPHLTGSDGLQVPNPRYEDPAEFLTGRSPAESDPLEATMPAVDIVDPTAAVARRAARDIGHRALSEGTRLDDLVMAVSETVTNALAHGRPPVRLRFWAAPHRVLVAISDHGHGPADPFAGLLPTAETATGGLGLWLTHQICNHITLDRESDGFTVRLKFEAAQAGRNGHEPHPA
jgi:anti-sigma regulatory factor (Ser/Thr protein kinase)